MIRVYLSGQMTLESPSGRSMAADFPGQQGREAFAFLAMRESLPVSREVLLDALWGDDPPSSAEGSLNSIVSKLRRLLTELGLDAARVLRYQSRCYELTLPAGTWVDHSVAFDAIHQAEVALRDGDMRAAYGPSAIARQICRRPFLAGTDTEWVEQRRIKLRRTHVRALECRAEVYRQNGEHELAVEAAREATEVEPLRESAYRLLMAAHAGAGNTAEALAAYEQCRSVISEALGVSPSPQTQALKGEIIAVL